MKNNELQQILKKFNSLEKFTSTIESRMTRLEHNMISLEGKLAGFDLNTNDKFVELLQNQENHTELLEGIATEVKNLKQELAA